MLQSLGGSLGSEQRARMGALYGCMWLSVIDRIRQKGTHLGKGEEAIECASSLPPRGHQVG